MVDDGVPMMQTDKMLQPLGGKDCVTGERIEVVHADDCRKIELEGLELARELSQANNDLQETMQILGDILAPGGGIHIGDVPSMARDVAEKLRTIAPEAGYFLEIGGLYKDAKGYVSASVPPARIATLERGTTPIYVLRPTPQRDEATK